VAAAAPDTEKPCAQRGRIKVTVAAQQGRDIEGLEVAAVDAPGGEAVTPAE
jgi:hypothetical protein